MKVYLFHLKINDSEKENFPALVESDLYLNNPSLLYAFTNDIIKRNDFIKYRNMSIFYERIIDIEKDKYEELCNEFSDYLLDIKNLTTDKNENDIITADVCDVLCTEIEYSLIELNTEYFISINLDFIFNMDEINMIMSKSFKNKINDALFNNFFFDDVYYRINPIEEVQISSYFINEFNLFIKIFKNTFKK